MVSDFWMADKMRMAPLQTEQRNASMSHTFLSSAAHLCRKALRPGDSSG